MLVCRNMSLITFELFSFAFHFALVHSQDPSTVLVPVMIYIMQRDFCAHCSETLNSYLVASLRLCASWHTHPELQRGTIFGLYISIHWAMLFPVSCEINSAPLKWHLATFILCGSLAQLRFYFWQCLYIYYNKFLRSYRHHENKIPIQGNLLSYTFLWEDLKVKLLRRRKYDIANIIKWKRF
jgi:hypothetical protein